MVDTLGAIPHPEWAAMVESPRRGMILERVPVQRNSWSQNSAKNYCFAFSIFAN